MVPLQKELFHRGKAEGDLLVHGGEPKRGQAGVPGPPGRASTGGRPLTRGAAQSGCADRQARYDGSEEANVVAYKLPIESIIGRESALRKIPSNVEARGRLHLDAIRCCIEAI